MKKEYIIAVVALLAIVFIYGYKDKIFSSNTMSPEIQMPASKVTSTDNIQEVFNNYCLGCHNDKKGSFVNRTWLFGNGREDIFKSIKNGRIAHGMPSFEDGFSEEVIYGLADYILGLKEMVPLLADEKAKPTDGLEHSEDLVFKVDTVVTGLDVPWGLAFLPNGDLLISERDGRLYRYTSKNELLV